MKSTHCMRFSLLFPFQIKPNRRPSMKIFKISPFFISHFNRVVVDDRESSLSSRVDRRERARESKRILTLSWAKSKLDLCCATHAKNCWVLSLWKILSSISSLSPLSLFCLRLLRVFLFVHSSTVNDTHNHLNISPVLCVAQQSPSALASVCYPDNFIYSMTA